MQKTCYTFCCILFLFSVQSQSLRRKKALFIGNSYTYVNNLPVITSSVAASFGDTLIVDSYAPGGYTFNNHFNDPGCLAKIALGGWDYVILQAQSQEPSFAPQQVNAQTLPWLLKLDSVIRKYNACCVVMLYETWGRKNGDQSNCAVYPPVCTYSGMQNRLRSSYKLFADTVRGVMAPVGEAFRASITASPSLELYQADESHPSLEGTYLAALVFYESIFHRSALNSTYSALSSVQVQNFLQAIAHKVVADSLPVWNQGINAPWAGFTPSLNASQQLQLNSLSPSLTNQWYISPGTATYNQANPVHSFSVAGSYTVSHVVKKGCLKDSAIISLLVSIPTGLNRSGNTNLVSVFPQPAKDRVYLDFAGQQPVSVSLQDLNARCLFEIHDSDVLDISAIRPGIYFLRLDYPGSCVYLKLIKE